jgi:thioredoxin 1
MTQFPGVRTSRPTAWLVGAGLLCALALLVPGCKSGNTTEVTESNFDSVVLASPQPVLVDFSATRCPPCRSMEPVLEELAADFKGKAVVAKVDIDQDPGLARQYGVTAIPCFVLFKGGKAVDRKLGAISKKQLAAMLDAARSSSGPE